MLTQAKYMEQRAKMKREIIIILALSMGALRLADASTPMFYRFVNGEHLRLAPNFTASEFHCRCGKQHGVRVSGKLLYHLELLRARIGKPVRITSGFRCVEHNALVGGSKHSMHLSGEGADIVIKGMTMAVLADHARGAGFGFVLDEGDHVHVDVREGA